MGMLPPNIRPDLDALRVDVAVAALRDVVKDGWSVLGLSTGMVDALTDQAGIASLGGATYDGTARTVSNPGGEALVSSSGAAISGDFTMCGGNAAAFDGLTNRTYNQSAVTNSAPGVLTIQFASAKALTRFVFWAPSDGMRGDGGSPSPSVQIRGSNDGGSTWAVVRAAASLGSIAPGASVTVSTGLSVGSYLLYEFTTTGVAVTYGWAEIQMYEPASPSLATVASNAFPLGFQPTMARIVAPMEVGSGVVGVDGLLDLSRDGATWAAVPLADLGKFDASTRIVGGLVDLSGQPAGSSIYWRWRTTAGIAQALHGVWVQCK